MTHLSRAQITAAIYAGIVYNANTSGLTDISPSTGMDLRIVSTVALYPNVVTVDQPCGILLPKPPASSVPNSCGTHTRRGRPDFDAYLDEVAAGVSDVHLAPIAAVYGGGRGAAFPSTFNTTSARER
jgi:hypothetical protein